MTSLENLSPGRPSAAKSKDKLMQSLEDVEPTRRVNFELAASNHQKLRIQAAKRSLSIKKFLTAYIDTLPNE
ncbi:hypothetical protein [Arthrobacter sp. Leaf137]|uniref:hypothetical protein n=1 Tax=Arthrobacter sp. Leaf137 TaxID=1736271 RepID=UPI0006F74A29|nr:hypothetical protein [Arthrobacter sp. Leaf137]KQQ82792.1 hypothetical protein ASF64_09430 [Arthrobacter sp. Leaf137]